MNLPDIEQTCESLGEQIKAFAAERGLDDPLLVGIRTGGDRKSVV